MSKFVMDIGQSHANLPKGYLAAYLIALAPERR